MRNLLNTFYDKFLFTNTLKYQHNNFYLLNMPFLMMPVDVIAALLEISDTEFQKKIYTAIKMHTKENLLQQFSLTLGVDKKKELDLLKDYFTASGWGNLQTIDLEFETKRAIILVENSPFAAALKGKSASPVDTFLRGVLAGLFSKIFNEDIDCVEVECLAQNSERCKFIIKPKTEFDFTNAIVQQQLSAD